MPIYAYKCASCGHADDVLQKMSDDALTKCPACGAETYSKQVTAPAFALKGSGWYVTDFRDGKKPDAKPADAKPADAKSSEAAPADGAGTAVPAAPGDSTKPAATTSTPTATPAAKAATPAAKPAPSTT